jgi:hypothetical protein
MPEHKTERPKQRSERQVISIEELPEEFIAALKEPYDNAEQAALDYLMDERDPEPQEPA